MLQVKPLSAGFGLEASGIDLSDPLSDAAFAEIEDAFFDGQVLTFRHQRLAPPEFVAFARRFGPPDPHVIDQFHHPDDPSILILSNVKKDGKPTGLQDAGSYFHTDYSYLQVPARATTLYSIVVPKKGGDTLFANQHTAWERLPGYLQRAVRHAKAEHSYLARYADLQKKNPWRPNLTQAQIDEVKPVVQPVVRTHPETGRLALFVSEHFTTKIVGLPEDESRTLLAELFDHSTRAEHVYRHRWQPHDMVFWDNRSVMHLAAGCPDDQRRKLYRTTIEGDAPY